MKCKTLKLSGGGVAIVCGRTVPEAMAPCSVGPPHPGGLLCDWPVARGKSCDAPLCERHAAKIGPDSHLCPKHARVWRGES